MSDAPVKPVADDAEPSDDDLITAWGLGIEAMAATNRILAVELRQAEHLAPSAFEVLLRLLRTPGSTLATTELARQVSFSSGGFTKLADRLVADGLLTRSPCPGDRRVVHLALSPAGRAVAERAVAAHAAGLRAHVLGALGAPGVANWAGLMRVLRDRSLEDA